MSSPSLLSYVGYTEIFLCIAGLCIITAKQLWRNYWALGAYLGVRVAAGSTLFLLHFFGSRALHRNTFCEAYFYVYWIAFAIEAVLALVILYSVLRLTLTPLTGLQRLGKKIFDVTCFLGLLLVTSVTIRPISGTALVLQTVSRLQLAQSLITLCVGLLFLVALRPMGHSFRSPVFGIGLGLSVLAVNDLSQAGWLALHPPEISLVYLVNGLVMCLSLLLWAAYLAMPEPEHGGIASRLLRWNERLIGAA